MALFHMLNEVMYHKQNKKKKKKEKDQQSLSLVCSPDSIQFIAL